MIEARYDERTVDELLVAALASDDDDAWHAVAALQWRGTQDVLDAALLLSRSVDPWARQRAADIMGQLGARERSFPVECLAALRPMLADPAVAVVRSAVYALGHLDREQAAADVMLLADHGDGEVRQGVAFALGGIPTPAAIAVLLQLTRDSVADVRDWATFAVGTLVDVDAPELRAALAERLNDEDDDVRFEAVVGLGLRRDWRAIPWLKVMLHEDPQNMFLREAAVRLCGLPEDGSNTTADLLGVLQRRQRWLGRR